MRNPVKIQSADGGVVGTLLEARSNDRYPHLNLILSLERWLCPNSTLNSRYLLNVLHMFEQLGFENCALKFAMENHRGLLKKAAPRCLIFFMNRGRSCHGGTSLCLSFTH